MLLQPSGTPWSPWTIGNYQWSSAFIWIAAVAGLLFGMLLFASYVTTHKRQLLLWSFGFLGIWVFFHQMITVGKYNMMVLWSDTSMFGIPTDMLTLLIPGFFAAGLCFAKDVKFGRIFTWCMAGLTVIYTVLQLDPSSGQIPKTDLYAEIAAMLVTLPSGILMIVLPIIDVGKRVSRVWMGLGGIMFLTINILVSLIVIFSPLHNETVDIIFKIMPFFLLGAVIFTVFGIIGKEEYGFKLPHPKLEGEK